MPSQSEEFAEWLKSRGQWEEFRALKSHYELTGIGKKVAYNRAAKQMGFESFKAQYGGVRLKQILQPPEEDMVEEEPVSREVFGDRKSGLREDFQWVYENIAIDDVSPADAPSSGAWGLLEFARSDTRTFYAEWMRMVAKSETDEKVLEAFVQDATKSTAEIAEMLRSLSDAVLPDDPEGSGVEPEVESGDSGEVSE
jgi:hypothetical protein